MKTEGSNLFYSWFMDSHINEFYCYYKNVFSEEEIAKIIEIGEQSGLADATIGEEKSLDLKIRDTKVAWIPSSDSNNEWLFRKVVDVSRMANERFFNFDIHTIQNLQYSVYNKGSFYSDHVDTMYSSPLGVRKLSIVIMLSDPEEYEGGELLLKYGGEPVKPPHDKGTVIFFPSYLLHQVTPVKKGIRKTLVSWVLGPNFK